MITKNNFKDMLKTLGFKSDGNIFQKSIGEADLKVDFDKKEIIYPEDKGLKVNERQTCNFSQNENFVVFECVYRLLNKGYKPKHLELEPRWRVGHGASGGRADILVRDQENNPLLIIECKTAGDEFEKAWDETRQNGGQLFSYAHQDAQTQYLCLYASSFLESELDYKYKLIHHLDNPQILAEDTTLMLFENANKADDRFAVWRDTYKLEFTEVGIFEENIQAYQIGKDNYTLAEDTKPIGAVDKDRKYHDFRTILRKHNIARRENAFEVLVNLFLCKLVDEEENRDNLQFYWNGPAFDDYFDFVDRLQKLYQRGMHKFLNEEISYISSDQIDAAFWPVKNDRNATKKQIQAYFRELKFFSNSAFSFLDTHNKELFNKNTAVLSEVVQMWQGLRLKTDDQNQFLGDMFEFFLDNGIKQSEGQFFTPLPICKFILASLPLAQKIADNPEPIKAIDYACGSGHFLNEYAYQIKPLLEAQNKNISDYYSQITGIEKEDRLAKVAKVAAYMHGQEQIKILDADALAVHSEIQRENFDILVANPPFSVEGFLQTLSDVDKEQYQLIQTRGENSNTDTIQCFFLERIHHLMAPDGVVGVIVPSSILSNTEAIHKRTREILLQFFNLVSIAELGQGAFGKTSTNTVVLFLKRKAKIPESAEHYRNRVEDFFSGDDQAQYQDDDLIEAYCKYIDVTYEEYTELFAQTSHDPLSNLLEYDIFKDYRQDFDQSTEIKKLNKSTAFKKKTPTERSAELDQRFITYLHNKEKEKLYYFILAYKQENKVLIVNAPNTSKERKQFLGYEWSSAKGREGIKYDGGDTVNDIITPLFDPQDLDNNTKINTAIKRNFIGEITDSLPEHCHYTKLTSMLNFSLVDFDKIINLNPQHQIEEIVQSITNAGYETKKLGEVVNIIRGVNYDKNEEITTPTSNIILTADNITLEGTFVVKKQIFLNDSVELDDEKRLKAGDIFICFSSGSKKHVGKTAYIKHNTEYYAGGFMGILRNKDINSLSKYLFELLNIDMYRNIIKNTSTGSNIQNLSSTLEEIKIPLPPPEVQKQIVGECNTVDNETDQARQVIVTAKRQIAEKVNRLWHESTKDKLDNVIWINTKTYNPTQKPDNEFIYIDIDSVGKANGAIDYSKRLTGNNAPSRARRIAKNGNTIISTVRPYLKGFAFIDTDDIDDCVFSTGFAVLESKNPQSLLNKVIFYFFMYMDELMQQMKNTMGKSSYPSINESDIKNYQIPVPPLNVQQQLVAEVEQLETEIIQAQAVIDNATQRKNAILTKYL